MRVLFLDQFSDFGGAQLGLRDIMEEGVQRGWESWFAAPGHGNLFGYCEASGIPARKLDIGKYSNGSKSLAEMSGYVFDMGRMARVINEVVRENRIDVAYVNGPRVLAAAAGIPCPLIFHLHSVLDKTYSRAIARWILRRKRGTVIAASHFVAEGLRDGPKGCELKVIYNGVCDSGFLPRPRERRVRKVGIIGRIAPEKGHLDLLSAAERLAATGRDVQITIVGASLFSDPAYADRVRKAAAGKNVECRGWTDDVSSVLQEIDVLAIPSASVECSPRILLEAFSAGTPIVAYRSGGIPELVCDGQTGLLTEKGSPESLATAIERLVFDRDLMARLSINGRREWESRFRIERFRSEIANLVERTGCIQGRQSETSATITREDDLVQSEVPRW